MTRTCPDCGADLADVDPIRATMHQTNGGPDLTVGRGFRVTLAPGFVNAKRRHPSGLPWFTRHPSIVLARSPAARAPCVVTCRCGRDVQIDRMTNDTGRVRRG